MKHFEALIALAVFLGLATTAFARGPDEMRARAFLVRDAASPDGDVKGHVEIRSDAARGRERFKVEVEKLVRTAEITIRIGDGAGGMTTVATLSANGRGEVELELATNDGAALPAGATTTSELSGRPVEVVDGHGATLLVGSVPSFGAGGEAAAEPDDDGRSRAFLTRFPDASDRDARGHVEIRSDRGRERFEIEIKHLTDGAAVSIEIADGFGGTVGLGTHVAGRNGRIEIERDTRDGDPLPGGADRAENLAGRELTVRDAGGEPLLIGTVPSLDVSPARPLRGRTVVRDDASGVKVKIDLKTRRDGSSRVKVKFRRLPTDAELELWIDDGSGLTAAASLDADSRGKSRLRMDTRRGDAMLLDLASAADLAGRAFQVRTAAGETLVAGTFPRL